MSGLSPALCLCLLASCGARFQSGPLYEAEETNLRDVAVVLRSQRHDWFHSIVDEQGNPANGSEVFNEPKPMSVWASGIQQAHANEVHLEPGRYTFSGMIEDPGHKQTQPEIATLIGEAEKIPVPAGEAVQPVEPIVCLGFFAWGRGEDGEYWWWEAEPPKKIVRPGDPPADWMSELEFELRASKGGEEGKHGPEDSWNMGTHPNKEVGGWALLLDGDGQRFLGTWGTRLGTRDFLAEYVREKGVHTFPRERGQVALWAIELSLEVDVRAGDFYALGSSLRNARSLPSDAIAIGRIHVVRIAPPAGASQLNRPVVEANIGTLSLGLFARLGTSREWAARHLRAQEGAILQPSEDPQGLYIWGPSWLPYRRAFWPEQWEAVQQ